MRQISTRKPAKQRQHDGARYRPAVHEALLQRPSLRSTLACAGWASSSPRTGLQPFVLEPRAHTIIRQDEGRIKASRR